LIPPPVCPFEFYDGFERGDFSRWNVVIEVPFDIVTDPVKYGTYAAKSKPSYGEIYHTIPSSPSDYYVRFWFKLIGTVPTGPGASEILRMWDLELALYFYTGYTPNPCFALYSLNTSAFLMGIHVIPLDTWICIEILCQANNASGVHKLWIDDVLDISLSDDTSGYYHTHWNISNLSYAMGYTGRMVIDGVISDPSRITSAFNVNCEG